MTASANYPSGHLPGDPPVLQVTRTTGGRAAGAGQPQLSASQRTGGRSAATQSRPAVGFRHQCAILSQPPRRPGTANQLSDDPEIPRRLCRRSPALRTRGSSYGPRLPDRTCRVVAAVLDSASESSCLCRLDATTATPFRAIGEAGPRESDRVAAAHPVHEQRSSNPASSRLDPPHARTPRTRAHLVGGSRTERDTCQRPLAAYRHPTAILQRVRRPHGDTDGPLTVRR